MSRVVDAQRCPFCGGHYAVTDRKTGRIAHSNPTCRHFEAGPRHYLAALAADRHAAPLPDPRRAPKPNRRQRRATAANARKRGVNVSR